MKTFPDTAKLGAVRATARWTLVSFMLGLGLLVGAVWMSPAFAQQDGAKKPEPSEGLLHVVDVFNRDPYRSIEALGRIEQRGNPDVAHALVELIRFFPFLQDELVATLKVITGDDPGPEFNDWVLWSQRNPDVASFPDYDRFKGDLYSNIDPDFKTFLHAGVEHAVRLEEVTWGGVAKDGIPALDNPASVAPDAPEAAYITDDELVFGVEVNGDARAYPLRILDWHEMFNDVVGGVPVSLAYCTLCASGILFEGDVQGQDTPFTFGSSGFLMRSNKLMYDRQTNSLWNQFTGEPVVGPLVGSGIRLNVRPVAITTWGAWRAARPKTKVLSIETGFDRDYTPGKPYGDYFNSPDLMFPVALEDTSAPPKAYVYAVRHDGVQKAWMLELFASAPVRNDAIGDKKIVLVGEVASRTVRAYLSGDVTFVDVKAGTTPTLIDDAGRTWEMTEGALVGQDGAELKRLGGHIAYWFAFRQFIPDAEVVAN